MQAQAPDRLDLEPKFLWNSVISQLKADYVAELNPERIVQRIRLLSDERAIDAASDCWPSIQACHLHHRKWLAFLRLACKSGAVNVPARIYLALALFCVFFVCTQGEELPDVFKAGAARRD